MHVLDCGHSWPAERQQYIPSAVSLTGLALGFSTAAVQCLSQWLQNNVYNGAAV